MTAAPPAAPVSIMRVYTLAMSAILIYGLTPILTKIAVGGADGITVGALRAVVAAPVALLFIASCRWPAPRLGRPMLLTVVSGMGGLALFPVFFSWGVQYTTAGHAAAGTASGAVMAGVLAAVIDRRWPGPHWWIGIAVGFGGALLLIWEAVGLDVEGVTWQGDALVFLGMFLGVVGYTAGARVTKEIGTVPATMWSIVFAAIAMLPLLAVHSGVATLRGIGAGEWAAIAALALGTTILAYLLWNRALADGGVERVGAFQLLQPVIAIVLAPVVLGEPVTAVLVVATAVILAGMWLVQRAPRRLA